MWSRRPCPAHGCPGREGGLKSSLGSYCQAACLDMEEGVPFSNVHRGAMRVPGSPGPSYRPRTHSYNNVSALIETGINNCEKGGESREGVEESDREGRRDISGGPWRKTGGVGIHPIELVKERQTGRGNSERRCRGYQARFWSRDWFNLADGGEASTWAGLPSHTEDAGLQLQAG